MIVVGIGEMAVSNRPDDIVVTYSLGSCIGLTVYDPVARCGGLIHCKLPTASGMTRSLDRDPCAFVDTGVVALLRAVCDLGARVDRIVAKMAGGAVLFDDGGIFKIGDRNRQVARRVLEKNLIPLAGDDTGGTAARTMYLHLSDGRTMLRSQGREYPL